MNFDLSEDQQQIKRTARELLASRMPMERVRAAAEEGRDDAELWRELVELGWPGIAIAEEHGGQGLGIVELAALLEELGYACAPTPFLGTALAALVIEHAGSAEQRGRWLPALASGEATGALGVLRDGVAELVPDAPGAAVLVLADPEAGTATLVEASAGSVEETRSIDPTRRYGRVEAGGGDPLEGDVAGALDRAAVAVSAELVGLSQRALDMTIAYVKDRKQFGVPVGAFQAVQHKAAQMLRDTESARSATYYAAWAADADPERLPMAAAMAKAVASEAGRTVTGDAIQLHGGIGFTWEADVHWLFKRAQLDAPLLGGGATHRARVARLAAEARTAKV
ncbi:MAG TPA: acyl-CoA dehydrogenase family protein [Solirubrobacteraceae bacterium]|jgi:alkylation response protein AidB-like acyl-CoA dehydrogenase